MLRIYVTNLGKYNEGHLIGEWLELPATEEEIKEVFERIGINEEYEEFFITDYESNFGVEVSEYANIHELNELAERIENFDDYEIEALEAFIEAGYDFDIAIDHVERQNYFVYGNCDSMTDVAYEVVEMCGYLDNVPEQIANYFDYEAFGRDLNIEGTYIFIGSNCYELTA